MVTVNTKVETPTQRARAKMERLRKMHVLPGVRVEPADDPSGQKRWTADDMRRLLKHPRAGGFRSEGGLEWPNDTFTLRRIREGSVKVANAKHDDKPARSHAHAS